MGDFYAILTQYVNMQAALVGVFFVQLYRYLIPGPIDGEKSLQTVPGKIWDRLMPFVAPVTAMIASVIMEYRQLHPELGGKAGVTATDVVRGMLSGLASEYLLRIYYKTIKGI